MRQIVGKYQSSQIGVLNYVTHCACLVIADYYVFLYYRYALEIRDFVLFLLSIYFLVWWCIALPFLPWESQGPRMNSHGDNCSTPRC